MLYLFPSDVEVEVAVLRNEREISKITLTPIAKYKIAFVVTVIDSYYLWDVPVTFTITLPSGKKEECVKSLRRMPQQWWEQIPICEFVMSPENVSEFTFALNEHGGNCKSGLVIKSVSFRPIRDTYEALGHSGDR
ncbi:uncharacterized protein J3R85_007380 [Psidium guajava]|nr:uncharacterized protein J3R85_007380 [Psidium guajava]